MVVVLMLRLRMMSRALNWINALKQKPKLLVVRSSIILENQLLNVIEDMKLDIEILQTETAALQTFVNSSEASAVGFDIIQEVTRLKCDLSNEGEKSKRLELELYNMKNKLLELWSYRQNTDDTNNFKDNSLLNDPNQVHLQKVIPTKADPA